MPTDAERLDDLHVRSAGANTEQRPSEITWLLQDCPVEALQRWRRQAGLRTYPFDPDYCVAPGATVQEYLDKFGISRNELARRMENVSVELINGIIDGRIPITEATARKLEYAGFGLATLWMNLEHTYRAALAAGKQDVSAQEG